MNDIVERLRARAKSLRGMGSIAHVDADTDDEAADEITHLRKKVEWHTHAVHTCHAECDRPLCQTTRERDTLRAENERLKAEIKKRTQVQANYIAFLDAENDRLRAALEDILSYVPHGDLPLNLYDKARAAITKGESRE